MVACQKVPQNIQYLCRHPIILNEAFSLTGRPTRLADNKCWNLVQSLYLFFTFLLLHHSLALQGFVLHLLFLLDLRQFLVLHAKTVRHFRLLTALFRLFLRHDNTFGYFFCSSLEFLFNLGIFCSTLLGFQERQRGDGQMNKQADTINA